MENTGKREQKLKKADRKKKKISKIKIRENIHMTLMVIPGLVLLLIFAYLPMPGIMLAFKKFNPNKGILGSPWVGVKNFEFFFSHRMPSGQSVIRCYTVWAF